MVCLQCKIQLSTQEQWKVVKYECCGMAVFSMSQQSVNGFTSHLQSSTVAVIITWSCSFWNKCIECIQRCECDKMKCGAAYIICMNLSFVLAQHPHWQHIKHRSVWSIQRRAARMSLHSQCKSYTVSSRMNGRVVNGCGLTKSRISRIAEDPPLCYRVCCSAVLCCLYADLKVFSWRAPLIESLIKALFNVLFNVTLQEICDISWEAYSFSVFSVRRGGSTLFNYSYSQTLRLSDSQTRRLSIAVLALNNDAQLSCSTEPFTSSCPETHSATRTTLLVVEFLQNNEAALSSWPILESEPTLAGVSLFTFTFR